MNEHYQRALDVAYRSCPSLGPGSGGDRADREALIDELTTALYNEWYCTDGWLSHHDVECDRADLVSAYRASDAGSARFEPGWTVVADGHVGQEQRPTPWSLLVERDGRHRWVEMVDVLFEPIGCRPQPGGTISVVERLDDTEGQPGWWMRSTPGWGDADDVVRVYWNAPATMAPRLVGAIVEAVGETGWALKALTSPSTFTRSDSIVLYVDRRAWDRLRAKLTAVASAFRPRLRSRVPPLTKPVDCGVAVADDIVGDSFGRHRCRLLATAIATQEGADVAALRQAMAESRLDPERPWLRSAGGPDIEWAS